jgi:hypothetical protein
MIKSFHENQICFARTSKASCTPTPLCSLPSFKWSLLEKGQLRPSLTPTDALKPPRRTYESTTVLSNCGFEPIGEVSR